MVEVKEAKSDLPAKRRVFIREALRVLWEKHVTGATVSKGSRGGATKLKPKKEAWASFARALKQFLDAKCDGPHWHVVMGDSIGFACKKRNGTMGVWRIGEDKCMVIVYQSPGVEPFVSAGALPKPEEATEAAEPAEGSSGAPKVTVLEPVGAPDGSEAARAAEAVCAEVSRRPGAVKDVQDLTQALRLRLTGELGTIWHVLAGRDMVFEVAENRRNSVVAEIDGVRVCCFQHEQKSPSNLLDWLPHLLLVIFCFGTMGLSNLCVKDTDGAFTPGPVADIVCPMGAEDGVYVVGALALGTLALKRTMAHVKHRQREKEKSS